MNYIKKIYLDMDGVLSDFDKMLNKNDIDKNLPDDEFWKKISETRNFWTAMPVMPGANQLVEYVKSLNVPIEILTAPSRSDPKCIPGKTIWAQVHFDFPINFKRASEKWHLAGPGIVLIDDMSKNIDAWNKAGGIGILHNNVAQTIKELKEFENE